MRMIQATMGLFILSFLFPLVPVSDDEMFSGAGGAIACITLWLWYVIIYSCSILWVVFKKSETAAMMGCFLTWMIPLGISSIQSNVIFIMAFSIIPIALTVLIIRMLWFDYMIGKTQPPPSQGPEHDYPVARQI